MRFYNFTFPLTFATVVTALITIAPAGISVTDVSQAIVKIAALLPGFYIASLAAVSTFSGAHMDETMPEPAPEIYIKTLQTEGPEKLTRRMFLCYLFGYLSVTSLFLVFFAVALELVIPSIKQITLSLLPTEYLQTFVVVTKTTLLFALFAVLGSIFITSLQGIYY